MTGYDISTVMIENAREKFKQVDWHEGDVHQLPYESGVFQGAVCTLSIHHFEQLAGAFREVYRTLDRGRFVIFTSSPEQMKHYWLNEYFPDALEKSITQMPSIETVNEALKQAGFTLIGVESFLLDPHIQDLFLYSGKFAPELYLDERIRSGMSTFAHLASVEEVRAGCAKLKLDIETNKIKDVLERYHSRFGDYMYVVAEKK
ncbi:class I SAM-dependent methyltransferase [Shouchella lonarensis]|uniref:Methyltransferase domain-containing protein n=1 Tax=Shouchella lonarensis TaxID=1464122 RepID=A0A1G6GMD4_9BACI|nr:class I SAM-dependent methyltransferase [Shouchella lonarensis]SDB83182.1 Methyltransferase domain-containing protein [Shouchella lonarensis]